MPFARPTLQEIVDRVQSDLATRLVLTGAVLRRSALTVFARVLAGAVHLLHGHLEFLAQQIFPDTSEVEYLERQANLFGLTRIVATFAIGNATATGSNGSIIPAGTVLQRADGVQYEVDTEAVVSSGTATLALTATVAGLAGNADVDVVLTFVSPIENVQATATVASGGLAGGADAETDDALRERLLTRMRQPPHGGAADDYVAWAKEVAGVTRAWVYPQELGAGTVTVRFVRDEDGSGAAIIPSAGEVTAVQDYIDARRPVTATVTVVAPVAVALNFTIHIVPDNSSTRAAVQAELEDLLRRDGQPGGTILLSQIRVAVGSADGVTDFTITTPAANVTHTTGQLPIMGTITWN
jgi:uncharacterized phage protein gp47/JayE